jgi:hypothetical protein
MVAVVNRFNHNHWHYLLAGEVLEKHKGIYSFHLVWLFIG